MFKTLISEYGIASVRDKKQIYNVKAVEKIKKRSVFGTCPKTFADEVQKVVTAITLDSFFIRRVVQFGKHGCIIILYSDEIISMIRNVCCNPPVPTVIGVDKTYNLSKAFLTILSFKHPGIWLKSTCCPSILYGSMAIHSSSNAEVFSELFSALRLALKITKLPHISKMAFESDAQKSIVYSIKQTFYGALHFLCSKHIKDNVKEKIRSVN